MLKNTLHLLLLREIARIVRYNFGKYIMFSITKYVEKTVTKEG